MERFLQAFFSEPKGPFSFSVFRIPDKRNKFKSGRERSNIKGIVHVESTSQAVFTCSKSTKQTPEQCVKSAQS